MDPTVVVNLGLGHDKDLMTPTLTLAQSDHEITKIVCGGNHTMVLLSNGQLLGAGDNSAGQLGIKGSTAKVAHWTAILEDVYDVACSWEATYVVQKSSRNLLVSGSGDKGELGLGPDIRKTCGFQKIMEINGPLTGFHMAGSLGNVVISYYNQVSGLWQVHGWGSNTKCQLFETKSRPVTAPKLLIESSVQIGSLSLGKSFLFIQSVEGELLLKRGNLEADILPRSKISCMWSSTHQLMPNTKSIYSQGNNSHGQLFQENKSNSQFLQQHKDWEIIDFSTGSEHGLVVWHVSKNEYVVTCWGWGEHGNCGPSNQSLSYPEGLINDGNNNISGLNIAMRVNQEHAPRVFGGCASSWIVL